MLYLYSSGTQRELELKTNTKKLVFCVKQYGTTCKLCFFFNGFLSPTDTARIGPVAFVPCVVHDACKMSFMFVLEPLGSIALCSCMEY